MMTPITERSSADALPLIAFTGGGSAGHVTPNLALIEAWESEGGSTIYLGRDQSIEAELLAPYSATPFFKVPSERLRRYFHWANFIMPIIVLWGVVRAGWVLRRHRPHLLFSKGGFVALPVVIGAWLNRIPVVIHESDGSLGLANRLSLPFARVVCVAQPRARSAVNHRDVQVTGSPLRRDFLEAQAVEATHRFGLHSERPLLLIFGGSQGAERINQAVWGALDALLERYEVFHVVGPGKGSNIDHRQQKIRGYHQYEYIKEGFADLLAKAHLVVGRAGANAITELLALRRPALLVPLPSASSRGDQTINATIFVELGGGTMIHDHELDAHTLESELARLEEGYSDHVKRLEEIPFSNGTQRIISLLKSLV